MNQTVLTDEQIVAMAEENVSLRSQMQRLEDAKLRVEWQASIRIEELVNQNDALAGRIKDLEWNEAMRAGADERFASIMVAKNAEIDALKAKLAPVEGLANLLHDLQARQDRLANHALGLATAQDVAALTERVDGLTAREEI